MPLCPRDSGLKLSPLPPSFSTTNHALPARHARPMNYTWVCRRTTPSCGCSAAYVTSTPPPPLTTNSIIAPSPASSSDTLPTTAAIAAMTQFLDACSPPATFASTSSPSPSPLLAFPPLRRPRLHASSLPLCVHLPPTGARGRCPLLHAPARRGPPATAPCARAPPFQMIPLYLHPARPVQNACARPRQTPLQWFNPHRTGRIQTPTRRAHLAHMPPSDRHPTAHPFPCPRHLQIQVRPRRQHVRLSHALVPASSVPTANTPTITFAWLPLLLPSTSPRFPDRCVARFAMPTGSLPCMTSSLLSPATIRGSSFPGRRALISSTTNGSFATKRERMAHSSAKKRGGSFADSTSEPASTTGKRSLLSSNQPPFALFSPSPPRAIGPCISST